MNGVLESIIFFFFFLDLTAKISLFILIFELYKVFMKTVLSVPLLFYYSKIAIYKKDNNPLNFWSCSSRFIHIFLSELLLLPLLLFVEYFFFFFQRLALFKLFLELRRSKTKKLKEKSFFLGKLSRLVVTFFFLSKKKFSGISFLTPVLHLILYYISLFTIFFTFLHFNLCVIIYFTFLFIKRYNISWTVWLAMIFHIVTDRS